MQSYFILCPSYHGATVLALLLNNHSKLVCLGDTLPPRQYDATCACGEYLSVCEFWSEIRDRLNTKRFSGCERLLPLFPMIFRNQKLNVNINRGIEKAVLAGFPAELAIRLIHRKATVFTEICQSFSKIVRDMTKMEYFIDSKKPIVSIIVQGIVLENNSTKIIHLIRDPRGFVYSALRHGAKTSIGNLSKSWVSYHKDVAKLEQVLHDTEVLSIRHEDLCQFREETMMRIFDFLEIDNENVFCPPKNSSKHHLIGNSGTLKNFTGDIRCDRKWHAVLSDDEQKEILDQTSPLSEQFGYAW